MTRPYTVDASAYRHDTLWELSSRSSSNPPVPLRSRTLALIAHRGLAIGTSSSPYQLSTYGLMPRGGGGTEPSWLDTSARVEESCVTGGTLQTTSSEERTGVKPRP